MANELQEVPDFIKRIAARTVALFDDARPVGRAMPPVVSIKGNRFSLMINGDKQLAPNPIALDFVIVAVKKPMSRAYYAGKFDSSPDAAHNPPACVSFDSVTPEPDSPEVQSPVCRTCKQAEFGSKVDERGKETTACRQHKQLVIMIPGVEGLWLLNIPIASVKKQWAKYAADLEIAGKEDIAKFGFAATTLSTVATRATFDADVNGVLNFRPLGYADKFFSKEELEEVDRITKDIAEKGGNVDVDVMFWGPKGAERRTQYLEATPSRPSLPAPPPKRDFIDVAGVRNQDLKKADLPFTPDDYRPAVTPEEEKPPFSTTRMTMASVGGRSSSETATHANPATKPKPATPPITTTLVQDKDATDMLKSLGLGDIDI